MKTYAITIGNRKELAKRIEALTGEKSRYTFMPRCAYEIGAFTVEKNGTLTVQVDADQSVIDTLMTEGMIGAENTVQNVPGRNAAASTDEWDDDIEDETRADDIEETDIEPDDKPAEDTAFTEPLTAEISFPLSQHTVQSLTNLICMIHSRGTLLSKATGGGFSVCKELLDSILDDKTFRSIYELIAYIKEWNETNDSLTGICFGDDKLIFNGFGQAADAETMQTFTKLAAAMNKMAITQKRVQAKNVDDSNEKYALRIWLIRLGLNGADFKADRKRLMAPLSGHTAFRNDAERERWEAKQKEKRDALKSVKA